MTFLEAAIEILRRERGPLSASALTQRALELRILPACTGDAVVAMRECLEAAIRGRAHDASIECIIPDHYRLRPSLRPLGADKTQNHFGGLAGTLAVDSRSNGEAVRGGGSGLSRQQRSERVVGANTANGSSPGNEIEGNSPAHGSRLAMRNQQDNGTKEREGGNGNLPTSERGQTVEFAAPQGSGLEGVTDVALVMANAMSRLVDERPELRTELEAMQRQRAAAQAVATQQPPAAPEPARSNYNGRYARDERDRGDYRDYDDDNEDRRRRRRRRRKGGRRHDWSADTVITQKSSAPTSEGLLDRVAAVLQDAGSRSLHIRQIAEQLAQQGVLGGEISEIERSTTAALVSDALRHGNASRFVLRGDARYQLRGSRLPEPVAIAESSIRKAARVLERETAEHLVRWLESLGARALEAVVRIFCEREHFPIISSMPASRGMTRMVVEDPEGDDGLTQTLLFVIPKRANLDSRQIESEIDKSGCPAVMAFAMGELPDAAWVDDAKIVNARQLAAWMLEHSIAVDKVTYTVSVLDPAVIESIAGLDT